MGIYIDMDMPRDCENIAIFLRRDGKAHVWRPHYRVGHEYDFVPVPDHGRLIEAVMLRHKCYQHYEDFMKGKIDGKTALLNIEKEIIAAPTIIPPGRRSRKKAFQLCDSCNLRPSCPTGVALDSSECGKEIEIRTCKAYVQVKTDNPTIIDAEEGER